MTGPSNGEAFVDGILEWYAENGRHDLPWRQPDVSPFQLLLAEVMLQKTTARQVSSVYGEFLDSYPDLDSLLDAPEDEIAEAIAPLGLQKRADHVKAIGDRISSDFDGEVPSDRDELLELKGVGEYTADSLLVHVHGEDVIAVDTNVDRILSRAFGSEDSGCVEKIANGLVPNGEASAFLHGLIDLGSAVCTPSNPDCGVCPVSDTCLYTAETSD